MRLADAPYRDRRSDIAHAEDCTDEVYETVGHRDRIERCLTCHAWCPY